MIQFSLNKYSFFIHFYLMLFNALCISSIPLDIENINTNNDDNDSSSEIKSAELSTTQSSLIVDMNNSSTEPANSEPDKIANGPDPDTVFAECEIKPNRRIALLNQQDVQGFIRIRQHRHNNESLNMEIRLYGFKVDCFPMINSSQYQCSLPSMPLHTPDNEESKSNSNELTTVSAGSSQTDSTEPNSHQNDTDRNYRKPFAMHIHESSDMTYDCQSVGSHYNPFNMTHGGPDDIVKHLGDLGNIYVNQFGRISMSKDYSHISLFGPYSIVNRSIVIHAGEDDYGRGSNPGSKTTGNSGVRIACCTINLLSNNNQNNYNQY